MGLIGMKKEVLEYLIDLVDKDLFEIQKEVLDNEANFPNWKNCVDWDKEVKKQLIEELEKLEK